MLTLGIETSCDETGVALYAPGSGLLAHVLHTQSDIHARFGGVVPELSSRDHVVRLLPLLQAVLAEAELSLPDLEGIAYTQGPGLVGALLTGAMFGRTLAYTLNIPAVGVHHLEGHLLAAFLEPKPPQFPFLALLVSGSHTELIKVLGLGQYQQIGDTLDDAVGEAFDKTARLLGLGYPGGAALSELAKAGDTKRFHFPRPMINRQGLDFSFSGLKTFALNTVQQHDSDMQTKADIARAFEDAVVETLMIKCRRALIETGLSHLVVAGGVAANRPLRQGLQTLCNERQVDLFYPRPEFCTDNGAMIAYAGCLRLQAGQRADLAVDVRARWPLSELKAP